MIIGYNSRLNSAHQAKPESKPSEEETDELITVILPTINNS